MIKTKKKDIRKMTVDQIKDFLTENGEKGCEQTNPRLVFEKFCKIF